MKHLLFPLLACIPCVNLVAKPCCRPAETEISRDQAREQFMAIYDYYRNTPSSLLFDKLETVDWDRPLNDSICAYLYACLDVIDGEFGESYAYRVYHYFNKHPEEYAFANSKLVYLPAKVQENVRVKLYNELYYTYIEEVESEGDKGWFFKTFPQAKELFPDAFIAKYYIYHGFASDQYFVVPVYVYDRKDKTANVRESPGGKVLSCLNNDSQIGIDSIQGKWCRIARNEYVTDKGAEVIVDYDGELWIHSSCLACRFRKDGDNAYSLYAEPRAASRAVSVQVEKDGDIDIILDKREDWIKVRLRGGKTGWVSIDGICGNPCP